jgi:hypothetical protein
MLNNLTSAMPNPTSSKNNEYEQMQKLYNCDMNYPGELLPPTPAFMIDPMSFQQRLEEIVNRRDEKMVQLIDSLLKEGSSEKRYFFAVGLSKRRYFLSFTQ